MYLLCWKETIFSFNSENIYAHLSDKILIYARTCYLSTPSLYLDILLIQQIADTSHIFAFMHTCLTLDFIYQIEAKTTGCHHTFQTYFNTWKAVCTFYSYILFYFIPNLFWKISVSYFDKIPADGKEPPTTLCLTHHSSFLLHLFITVCGNIE